MNCENCSGAHECFHMADEEKQISESTWISSPTRRQEDCQTLSGGTKIHTCRYCGFTWTGKTGGD